MYSPLQIAAETINEVIGSDIQSSSKDLSFELYFNENRKTLPPYVAGSEWIPAHLTLEVGIAVMFDLSPQRNPERVSTILGESVEPFVEGLYEGSGKLCLWRYPDGSLTPAYVSRFDYGPLDDVEIRKEVEKIFVRGVRILGLLTPVFYMIERGYMPSPPQRLNSLMYEHALWEVNNVSSDMPTHGVRFPSRLFGGIGSPLSQ